MADHFPEILCPVDLSAHSQVALGFAAAIADHFKARLSILYVMRSTLHVVDHDRIDRSVQLFARPVVQRLARFDLPRVLVRTGTPADVILGTAAAKCSDLVVMATHGAGASARVYGSTTAEILRRSPVPVLVIPPALLRVPTADVEHMMARARTILAPIDFHSRATADARIANAIASAFGVPLVLLHVASSADAHVSARAALDTIAGRFGGKFEVVVVSGDVAEETGRLALERGAGLIVMGLRGDRGRVGSAPGSIAWRVLARAPVPILALPGAPTETPAGLIVDAAAAVQGA